MLYALKNLLGTIFPLITYPYVSKVLGVYQLGKLDFSRSVVSYFVLLAGLGINTYVVREGAKIRQDTEKAEKLYAEVYCINLISTLISYVALIVLMMLSTKLAPYTVLIIIYSFQIILTTAGKEWILTIYEDYLYVSVRTITLQLIALVSMFIFVKKREDIYVYAIISLISICGSQLINFFYVKKYTRFKIKIKNLNISKHIKPILIMFGMASTIVVYVSSDITILGLLGGDYHVGLYSVASKVYSVLKTLISSILVVSIPRLSALLGKKDQQVINRMATHIYGALITVVVPLVAGILFESEDIIRTISSQEFLEAKKSLIILGFSLFFCMGAWFWGQCIMLPYGMENTIFLITVISAVTNIVLNFILIPFWKEDAAAVTTLLAETIAFFCCRYYGRKCVSLKNIESTMIKSVAGSIPIFFYTAIFKVIIDNALLRFSLIVLISSISYYFIELVLNNNIVRTETKNVMALIKK